MSERDAYEPETRRTGRERILSAAYELFSRSGIRAVGVDAITDQADVAKMTLYRNYRSKNELAVAVLALHEERWLKSWIQVETQARAASPADRLLAIFDLFTEWFAGDDFQGCPFVRSLLESDDRGDPVRQASVERLAGFRAYLCELAAAAGAADPERFAARWHMLLNGSIVAALEGDLGAATKARELGVLLLEHEGRADVAPAARCEHLEAVAADHVVRLAGELDAEAAATVVALIDKRGERPICLDLSELEFVDVAGLRALRGTQQHPIAIAAPSDAVLRLVGMLGWDADPDVQLRPARAA